MEQDGYPTVDPGRLTDVDWAATGNILTNLWLILGFVILFASLLLMAHAVIPSLLNSGHLPRGVRNVLSRQRFFMYMTAIIFVGVIAFWYSQATDTAHEIRAFWDRFWI